jgi:hypothetical protein
MTGRADFPKAGSEETSGLTAKRQANAKDSDGILDPWDLVGDQRRGRRPIIWRGWNASRPPLQYNWWGSSSNCTFA